MPGQFSVAINRLRTNSPELLPMLDAGMSPADLLTLAYKQKAEAAKAQRPDYMAVGKRVFDKNSGAFVDMPGGEAAEAEEWGLNPVWGTDANGRTVIGQTSKSGKFKPLDTGSFTPTPGLNNIDTGTSIITRNNRTGATMSETPKDLYGAESQKAGGKAVAEAQAALPQVEANANEMLSAIDSLEKDPYLDSMVGSVQGKWLPNLSSSAERVQSKMDQLGGQSFLQAFNSLRGGGQITEVEGAKATAAMGRLNAAQNEQDYRQALAELRGVVERSLATARAKAAGNGNTGNRTSSGTTWSVEP